MKNRKQNPQKQLANNAASVAATANAGASLVHEIVDIVRICSECAEAIEAHKKERARITETARVQISMIQSRREVMVTFLDRTFAERRENFQELFSRLDVALERDSIEGVRVVLETIVTLAKTSPFEALRDPAGAHVAPLDKNTAREF